MNKCQKCQIEIVLQRLKYYWCKTLKTEMESVDFVDSRTLWATNKWAAHFNITHLWIQKKQLHVFNRRNEESNRELKVIWISPVEIDISSKCSHTQITSWSDETILKSWWETSFQHPVWFLQQKSSTVIQSDWVLLQKALSVERHGSDSVWLNSNYKSSTFCPPNIWWHDFYSGPNTDNVLIHHLRFKDSTLVSDVATTFQGKRSSQWRRQITHFSF